ncbi:MAG: hypothetical protein OMM_07467 [Candidatus Magnetoglobus multicellularis str. Araruama]|uniref:Pancreas/duodenum homeobox protein 1 n=1 Tax=Candidatus Magnetoglobus multicellularis str. Araruama TaxID=890399 RepID=A0A1V1PCE9_9BACT|nr:MAG: hypothetical protein OMM_07467 [Candidatus Magnetoglobus multicellularis str. Araruama]
MLKQNQQVSALFTQDTLNKIFPPEKTNEFFEALFGDASEGAYDIRLIYQGTQDKTLHFAFELTQRPEKCLACSVTYGLPQVFQRHRIINTQNIVNQIQTYINKNVQVIQWELKPTQPIQAHIHLVPLHITLDQAL